jgi:hydrogenase nickel incorporation protein HypB
MCRDCGCGETNQTTDHEVHEHWIDGKWVRHSHAEEQDHSHPKSARKIVIEESVLAKNDSIAASNRKWFQEHKIRAFNLISAPGSGKTTLLEKTIERLNEPKALAILTGDQEGDFDAERLRAKGAVVKQLNTPSSCHLNAAMIQSELGSFVRPGLKMLIIENVGNLVCPAAFDLGEDEKIALLSTTEGEDKPSKYPRLFLEAKVIVITKMDLVPHLDWSLQKCEEHIRRVNPHAKIILTSAKTGQGLDEWIKILGKVQ